MYVVFTHMPGELITIGDSGVVVFVLRISRAN